MRDYMDKRVTPPKLATQARKNQFDNREQDLLAQSEGFGDFKGLTRFRKSLLFSSLVKKAKRVSAHKAPVLIATGKPDFIQINKNT